MEINVSEMKRVVLFEVNGRIESETPADELGNTLDRYVDEGKSNLVLDLSGVEYLSSAGMREMVRILKRVKRMGGDLRLCNLSDVAKEALFHLIKRGKEGIFLVYSTQIEAVGSF